MNRYELHMHTSESDRAAKLSGKELARKYHEAGYAGIVITDHYFSLYNEWFRDELVGADHKKWISLWMRGYYAAREEGEKLGLVVLPGAEIRLDGQINDYLIYGLDEQFFYDAPCLHHCQTPEELVSMLPEHACVVHAHPFRYNMTVIDPTPLFGLEGFNGGGTEFQNELAKLYAKHYQKPVTSGSDYHGHKKRFAAGGIMTERVIKTPRDLTDVLRSGDYSLIENYDR